MGGVDIKMQLWVAAWTRSEPAVSRGACVGQVDAKKLAQRLSVAIG
jgi:hypothetical protein